MKFIEKFFRRFLRDVSLDHVVILMNDNGDFASPRKDGKIYWSKDFYWMAMPNFFRYIQNNLREEYDYHTALLHVNTRTGAIYKIDG